MTRHHRLQGVFDRRPAPSRSALRRPLRPCIEELEPRFAPAVGLFDIVPSGAGLTNPQGLVFDQDRLLISDTGNDRLVEVANGEAKVLLATGLKSPSGLAVDAFRDVFIADTGNNRIVELDPTGTVTTFLSGLNGPTGLAVDGHGNLLVANTGDNSVVVAPLDGSAGFTTFVGVGLNGPTGLAFDGAGGLLIADTGNGRIVKADAAGSLTLLLGQLSAPRAVVADPGGNVIIADPGSDRLWMLTPSGAVQPLAGPGDGLNQPAALASVPDQALIVVANSGNNAVVGFSEPSLGGPSVTTFELNQSALTSSISIASGTGPFTLVAASNLPPGLSARLSGDQVVISGTPTQTGAFSDVGITVADAAGLTTVRTYTFQVVPKLPSVGTDTGNPGSLRDDTFLDQDGNAVSLGSLSGSMVILDLCASWCNPCRNAAAVTNQAITELKAEGLQFRYVTVLLQGNSGQQAVSPDARLWAKQFHLDEPVWVGANQLADDPMLQNLDPNVVGFAFPTFVFLTRDGFIFGSAVGAPPSGTLDYLKDLFRNAILTEMSPSGRSTTVLATSPTTAAVGQTVTLTATVLPFVAGDDVPTGRVFFRDGDRVLGSVPLAGGVASLPVANLAAGVHTITAFYEGSAGYVSSTSDGARLTITAPAPVTPDTRWVTAAADAGMPADVKVYDRATGQMKWDIVPFGETFRGGVRSAVADVTGDGVADIIVGAGPGGGPQVRVYDGVTGLPVAGPLGSFYALDARFRGGVFVAAGDVDGDGYADIIVGADTGGGPQVAVFSGKDGSLRASFYALPARFGGGVRVAAADVDGDGEADIIVGAGPGARAQVTIFRGTDLTILRSFWALPAEFHGGIFVAADELGRVTIGAGRGGLPQVLVVDARSNVLLGSFYAYLPQKEVPISPGTGAEDVRVAVHIVNGAPQIQTTYGQGPRAWVKVFDGNTFDLLDSLFVPTATNPADGIGLAGRLLG